MHGYIASQPILNLRQEIFGYELLYRGKSDSTEYDGTDGSRATRDVILNAFTEIGIENITRGRKAFVNFNSELLLNEVPVMLSNDILVVELVEDVLPTPQVVAACRELKRRGYMIALDDFIYSEDYEPLVTLADIIKIDFIKCSEREIRLMVKTIKTKHRKVLLAEKVETTADYELAVSLGFTLFQGYYFCRPAVTNVKRVGSMRASQLRLISYASDPDISFLDLANVLKQDVVLSYRLLKIVNSAYYGLGYYVKSILHALIILGLQASKKWLSLIILNEVIGDKPNELVRMALMRGIFMENIAIERRDKGNKDEYFLTGLFSLADAIMDAPIEAILKETHLSPEICEPLLTKTGERADYLQIISHIEQAEWPEALEIGKERGLSDTVIHRCYINAILDANKIMEDPVL